MPITEAIQIGLAAAASAVLTWAAVSDVRTRKIPNLSVLALLLLFLGWTGIHFGAPTLSSLEAAGIALAATVALYAFKVIGAGDSKLFAAAALFMGMGYLPFFALGTALAGGAIAAVSLASRPQRAMAIFMLRGKGDAGPGVPYGAAIAIGGIVVLWAMVLGLLDPYGYGQPAPITVHDISKALKGAHPGAF
jgi:prepilin peptidase CpaA